MSGDRAAGHFPVIDQSAFATLGTLQEYPPDYWGQMRALALALITQTHDTRLPGALPKSTQSNWRLAIFDPI
jgi:hypothetical protein